MVEALIQEDAEKRVYETTSAGWPDRAGSTRTLRVEWKPGSDGDKAALRDQRRAAAITKLEAIAAKTTPTAADTKFIAKVLALALPFLDLDPG
jgi:hypothetical protein